MGKHVQMKRMKLLLRKIDASQFAARNKSRSSCPVLVSSGAEQRKVTPENKGLVEPSLTSEEETKSSDDAAALPRDQEMVREMDMSETFSLSLQEDTTEEEDTNSMHAGHRPVCKNNQASDADSFVFSRKIK